MDQLKEMFGPLVEEQLGAMDWAAVKREAEGEMAPANRGKAPRTEQGKGGPDSQAHSGKPPWRRAGGKGRHADGPHQTQMIKALARLALQQQAALKILRQHYSWVLFVQPRNQGPLPLLYAAAQKWKKAQEENTTTTTLRTALFGCLLQMLHTGLKDIGSEVSAPFPEKGGGDEMVEGRPLELPKVVPCTREPGSGRSTGPSTTHQASGSDRGSAAIAHAAPHDTSVSCYQAPHGEHDRRYDLPAGYLQPHLRTPASVGMLRDNDGPHGSAGHRTPASEGHAQAVTGCRASPASIGRLLLIRLLNSSNTCYMNASVRAWLYAVSHMQVADILKYGQHEPAAGTARQVGIQNCQC